MRHWLVKSEPDTYGYDQLVADGRTDWTGVRNAQARNFLQEMCSGDEVLYYHTGSEKAVVAVARVSRAAFPDPTAPDDPRWVAVELVPQAPLPLPVGLAAFKADPLLGSCLLVRQGRLSVLPVTSEQFSAVLRQGGVSC